jgi:hypothetical protein
VALLSVVGLFPTVTNAGASATLSGLSPSQILATSIRSAAREKSAATVATTTVLGISVKLVTNSGPRSGLGFETVDGHKGEVIFLNGVLYAKFDADLIKFNYGVSNAKAANKWISITKVSRYYNNLSTGIAFPSILAELQPSGTLSASSPSTLDGVSVIGITGKPNPVLGATSGSQTLYVATTAPFLPVEVVIKADESSIPVVLTVTPKNWGAPVSVSAPGVFTPIARTTLPK